jgi:hypothetical protein
MAARRAARERSGPGGATRAGDGPLSRAAAAAASRAAHGRAERTPGPVKRAAERRLAARRQEGIVPPVSRSTPSAPPTTTTEPGPAAPAPKTQSGRTFMPVPVGRVAAAAYAREFEAADHSSAEARLAFMSNCAGMFDTIARVHEEEIRAYFHRLPAPITEALIKQGVEGLMQMSIAWREAAQQYAAHLEAMRKELNERYGEDVVNDAATATSRASA